MVRRESIPLHAHLQKLSARTVLRIERRNVQTSAVLFTRAACLAMGCVSVRHLAPEQVVCWGGLSVEPEESFLAVDAGCAGRRGARARVVPSAVWNR